MDERIESFFLNVRKEFRFLEDELGFVHIENCLEHPEYFDDTKAVVRYAKGSVGLTVSWQFTSAIVGVSFIEKKEDIFPAKYTYYKIQEDLPKAIELYSLAMMLANGDESLILLYKLFSVRLSSVKKREQQLESRMIDVLNNLEQLIRLYAMDILRGDFSTFDDVAAYARHILELQFPKNTPYPR